MANTIFAHEITKGTEIRLRDGRPATVQDNRKRSIIRTIKTVSPIFGSLTIGDEYIREWSCLPDGTRIVFDDKMRAKLAKVRAAGF